jgi:hypothetical protein
MSFLTLAREARNRNDIRENAVPWSAGNFNASAAPLSEYLLIHEELPDVETVDEAG